MTFELLRVALGCALLTCSGSAIANSSATPTTDDVLALVDVALAHNPDITAMRARTLELDELARVSSKWSDPHVSVEYLNAPVDSFAVSDTPMGGVQFKLQQKLPAWGWSRAARAVADGDVRRSRHERAETETRLRLGVETLYWKLALSRHLEALTQRHLDRTQELSHAARARYEVGRAGQNELLRLEVLAGRLEDDLGDHTRTQRSISAGLARVLATDGSLEFATPTELDAIPIEGDVTTWMAHARESRPALEALREEIGMQTDAASLSRTAGLPDVDVWVKYRLRTAETAVDDGTDFFSVGVSIPIPIAGRSRASGLERSHFAAREGARSRLAAKLDRIEAELIAAEASWQRAAEKAAAYETELIPVARAALETTLNDFAVGRADFSTLYEAETDLLDLERASLIAKAETRLQRAAVRAATGRMELGGDS